MSAEAITNDYRNNGRPYREAIRRFPMLSEQEEHRLARQWRTSGDHKSFDKLVTSHLRLVEKLARGYSGYGMQLPDLVSAGNLGLLEAVRRFDPDRGNRLATYAAWWIRAEIKQFILQSWSVVRTARTPAQRKLFFNLRRLKAEIKAADGQSLSPEDASKIAGLLKLRVSDVHDMNGRLSGHDLSLNLPIAEDAPEEWQDILPSEEMSPEAALGEREELSFHRSLLRGALGALNKREKAILFERRLSERPPTLDALSLRFGVSRERVRQIECQAIDKLRRAALAQQMMSLSTAMAAE